MTELGEGTSPKLARQRTPTEIASQRAAESGARLFAEKGYAATTTREIARAIGITNGTLYHHFETKEELLLRICDSSLDRMIDAAEQRLSTADGPRRTLEALIEAHVITMLSDQPLHKTGLIELRSLTAERLAAVVEKRDRYADIVKRQIERCQDASVLRTDIPAQLLTLLLLSTLNWTVFWFDAEGSLSPAELGATAARLFLEGALA